MRVAAAAKHVSVSRSRSLGRTCHRIRHQARRIPPAIAGEYPRLRLCFADMQDRPILQVTDAVTLSYGCRPLAFGHRPVI
jgi:hypothetical protein